MPYAPWNAYDVPGSTVFAIFDQTDGTVFDRSSGTLKAPATTTMANRAVTVLEDENNPGVFPVVIPDNLPKDVEPYKVTVYHQNGVDPVGGASDDVIGNFEGVWTSTTMYDRQVTPGTTIVEKLIVVQPQQA